MTTAGPAAPAGSGTAGRLRHRRRSLGTVALVVVTALVLLAGLALGSQPVSIPAVVAALTGHPLDPLSGIVVVQVRVPRVALGALVGAALAVSGGLLQGLTGNPLADSGLLGIGPGASLAVVAGGSLFGIAGPTATTGLALGGAAVATATVLLLARRRPRRDVTTLALSGAVLAALLSSGVGILLALDTSQVATYLLWTVGSLSGRTAQILPLVVGLVVVGLVLGISRAAALNALGLGPSVARALGVHPAREELVVAVSVVALAGCSVAAVGPVGFVGLAVPHLVRLAVGPDHRWVLPLSAVAGAGLLVLADTVGRILLPPQELDVGILTALLGAPVLVAVARRVRVPR